ncbi:hypothetical protein TanjilG_08451 [Lupinus angustifolius]|uniref:EamA domain-containing protein n=1 Tax=Lupinus angustifolius TaxID=3871 RepID=A0A1J7H4M5_LUPAN|nr:PREDICTED: uncharacterized vacuolar membrane protein YML018C-like [Lupinus angustifolius]OIW07564.1 hypothetical protein TanjilG_08451 [Lupinus angustifolius]
MGSSKDVSSKAWKWGVGLFYIFLVATIWIAASFVVQSVVDAGVSPFLVTYICNSLFVVLIPIVEIGRYFEDYHGGLWFRRNENKIDHNLEGLRESEQAVLLENNDVGIKAGESSSAIMEEIDDDVGRKRIGLSELLLTGKVVDGLSDQVNSIGNVGNQLDEKGRWTRWRVAKVSLLVCPFWFFAQLTFNLSLKYTTVTSNTILSSASSLFTFLVSLAFLGESFTWLKLFGVLLCMGGSIIVSLGDSENGLSTVASNPLLGDIFALVSAGLYAIYITLIRKNLPEDDGKSGEASMAQFLGYLGLFNILIFLPVALILHFTTVEPFHTLTWRQFGLIIGKGLLDNVLSDYLWAKAVILTSTTVATAGLTIQVPLAAIVDTVTGNAPRLMDYLGAAAVMVGFAGINIPYDTFNRSTEATMQLENENLSIRNEETTLPITLDSSA